MDPTPLPDRLQELARRKEELAKLETEIASEMKSELQALPARYGFKDAMSLYKAMVGAGAKRNASQGKRKERTKITPEMEKQVMTWTSQGMHMHIMAEKLGISMASITNIRKRNAPNARGAG